MSKWNDSLSMAVAITIVAGFICAGFVKSSTTGANMSNWIDSLLGAIAVIIITGFICTSFVKSSTKCYCEKCACQCGCACCAIDGTCSLKGLCCEKCTCCLSCGMSNGNCFCRSNQPN
jgi:hypothetical protein